MLLANALINPCPVLGFDWRRIKGVVANLRYEAHYAKECRDFVAKPGIASDENSFIAALEQIDKAGVCTLNS